MLADWRILIGTAHLLIEGDRVRVELSRGRRHEVRVEEHDDAWRIWAKAERVAGAENELRLLMWTRNRSMSLVSMRIDGRSRLIGEMWVPVAGATAKELSAAIHAVAIECDRVEFVRTGRDTR